jgi:hypothetical protein
MKGTECFDSYQIEGTGARPPDIRLACRHILDDAGLIVAAMPARLDPEGQPAPRERGSSLKEVPQCRDAFEIAVVVGHDQLASFHRAARLVGARSRAGSQQDGYGNRGRLRCQDLALHGRLPSRCLRRPQRSALRPNDASGRARNERSVWTRIAT